MFFILSKVFSFVTTPIIWLFVLLLAAYFKKDATVKKRLLAITIAVFFFFSNAFIFDEIVRKWEIPLIKRGQLTDTYTAGIVLGGLSVYDTTNGRLQFFGAGDRLFQAIELYKSGKIKTIFFVGGSGSIIDKHLKEGDYVQDYLKRIGIPDSAILIENESKNTHENALNSKVILDKRFAKGNYLLITSALHMRRSLACFNKTGIVTTPYSTDCLSGGARKFVFDQLLFPNAHILLGWNALLHEWIGYLSYKLTGYI